MKVYVFVASKLLAKKAATHIEAISGVKAPPMLEHIKTKWIFFICMFMIMLKHCISVDIFFWSFIFSYDGFANESVPISVPIRIGSY